MKIGIISDTHIGKDNSKLNSVLDKNLTDMELIVHAGDFKDPSVVTRLKENRNFIGVWGNVDDDNIKEIVKEREIVDILGYKIGIFHGHGDRGTTIDRAFNQFKDDTVDIIVFGHSHQPIIKTRKGILMLNPGSLTSKRRERWYSYIILELNEGFIDVRLRFLNYIDE